MTVNRASHSVSHWRWDRQVCRKKMSPNITHNQHRCTNADFNGDFVRNPQSKKLIRNVLRGWKCTVKRW